MRFLNCVAGVSLATFMMAGAASAATVTATFEGNTFFGSGPFLGTAGTTHTLEIVGRDDAPGMSATAFPEFFSIGSGSITSYGLTSMTYALPDEGRSFTSTDVTAYVGNNVIRNGSGNTVDGIAIIGAFSDGGLSGTLNYFAEFSSTTWNDDSSQEAIVAALTQAFTVGRGAGAQVTGGSTFGLIDIQDVFVVQDPPPDSGGGSTGGGDMSGGGGSNGGTPDLAPVPLPASAVFLLAGLGGLAWVRKRR